ncbi:uncharacterized protein M6B38_155910 [Iris pallida]|uniref:IST1-like protein n=1 Tax=Iris pallida TaxID=29817 RepID=A0AAX6F3R2_IRIPA|nr:uncharacterized protein M6B38_155910 [Iris pallida]
MFGSLLGGKFSNKCKHGVKCIRSRICLIRRKKHAMLNYLRRDVAELLSNGHDTNAFGRIEALIFEINHASCYDMIELYCECILQLLPSLQKQRECPEEAMEAMSTLIFAAARFSDLPELCDLRTLFTERYGSEMESSINGEFVEKVQKKSFSMEKKLQLMQHIAEEFSVPWDSKAFQQKLYNQQRLHAENWRNAAVKGRKEAVINVGGDREAPSKERWEPPPRNHVQEKQVQPEHRDFQCKVRSENNDQHPHAENWRNAATNGRKEAAINAGGDREAPSKERWEPPPSNHVQKEQVQPEHRDVQYKIRSENNDQHSLAENWRNAAFKGRKEAAIGDREVPSKERTEPPPRNFLQKEQVQPEPRDPHSKLRSEINDQRSHGESWRNTAIKGRKDAAIFAGGDRELPSNGRWQPPPTPTSLGQKEQVQPEPRDIHVISSTSNGRRHYPAERNRNKVDAAVEGPENLQRGYTDAKVFPPVKPKGSQNGSHKDAHINDPTVGNKSPMAREEPGLIGLENAKVLPSIKPKGRRNGTHKDAYLNEGAADCRSPMAREGPGLIGLEKRIVGQVISRDVKAVNLVPPYTKLNGVKNEIHGRDGLAACSELPDAEEKMDPIAQESRRPPKTPNTSDARLINRLPPYTKPNFKSPSTADDDIKLTNVPINGSNPADNDMSGGGERPKPFSVRRKHPKIPVVTENEDLVRKEGRREDDLHGEVKVVDRQPRQAVNADEASMTLQPRQAADQHASRPRREHRKHGSRSASACDRERDEEEQAMDRLLVHFSKKGTSKSRTSTRAPPAELLVGEHQHQHHNGNGRVYPGPTEPVLRRPDRISSLPSEPTTPVPEAGAGKGPARATSMQPPTLRPGEGLVHPRLPDYDELAARFIALKKT